LEFWDRGDSCLAAAALPCGVMLWTEASYAFADGFGRPERVCTDCGTPVGIRPRSVGLGVLPEMGVCFPLAVTLGTGSWGGSVGGSRIPPSLSFWTLEHESGWSAPEIQQPSWLRWVSHVTQTRKRDARGEEGIFVENQRRTLARAGVVGSGRLSQCEWSDRVPVEGGGAASGSASSRRDRTITREVLPCPSASFHACSR
jgi:hypothetical protein